MYFGYGSLGKVRGILESCRLDSIFIVADKASYAGSGAARSLERILRGMRVSVFSDFEPNPRIEDVEKGIALYRSFKPDAILAIGGGTAIDTAKLINVFANQDALPMAIVKKRSAIERKGAIMIAVPTTAGTGSEATHFAVVYADKVKYSVAHENVLPDYAIIDPALTLSMPAKVAASTGMDALAQGIESMWSVNSTAESRRYAEKAVRLAWRSLEKAVCAPDRKSKADMAKAAYFSGKAINISKTTAAHALSYFFTSHFNVPHGHAVGLTLGAFIAFNQLVRPDDIADSRGVAFVKESISRILAILKAESAEEAGRKINALMSVIGLETDLAGIGFNPEKDIERLLSGVNAERLENNPRRVKDSDISAILGMAK